LAVQTIPVIKMVGITKHFGKVIANDDVTFELFPGEIHGLLGENGAGKTTLMNILYGLHQPDQGEIFVHGQSVSIKSPHDAIQMGIGMVHQHFMQVPTQRVVDNVILGLKSAGRMLLNRDAARKRLAEISENYSLKVDPDAYIWQLSIGDRQRVEIIKALYRDIRVLILDEPTSVLTPKETEELFHTIRKLVESGLSVIFITHHLEEALSITDQITVLRNGKVVGTIPTGRTDKRECASMMVGREVLFRLKREDGGGYEKHEVLRVENLSAVNDRGTPALRGISFNVFSGEIVGIAGVDGNGQSELVQILTGLRPISGGRFWIEGKEMTHASPKMILQHGVGHIPENPDDGLIGEFNLVDNVMLDMHDAPPYSQRGLLDKNKMVEKARELIQAYDVRAPNERVKARTLSGGNKQKLIVAREISRNPRLLVAAHPTRGVDIGAEEYIRNLLLQKRHEGMAILLISTKLDEILSLSDRILVIERGRFMGEMSRETANIEKIGLLMAGSEA
jgi:ABC-type uncharacterized transport system ATPase subunit